MGPYPSIRQLICLSLAVGLLAACLEIARPTLPIFRQLFHLYFYWLVPLLGRFVVSQGEA
jgi:ubiquinone/menaquinone biosynthesis C-methylase UbiE